MADKKKSGSSALKDYNPNTVTKLKMLGDAIPRSDSTLAKSGWFNNSTGLGVEGRDKRMSADIQWQKLAEVDVEDIFAADDVAGRVVSIVPQMGTRNWIDITVGEEDGGTKMKDAIDDEVTRLDMKEKYRQAWEWSRLYGGAGIFWAVDDVLELSQPLDLNRLRKVRNLTVLHRYELHPHTIDWNLESPNFGKPLWYFINPRSGALSPQQSQLIHYTRFTRFDGVELPRRLHISNNYWGDSVLTRLYNVLRNFNMSHDSFAHTMQDFRVNVLKIKNLADVVASGDEDLLKKRIELMNLCKSVMGSVLLDAEDEGFDNLQTSLQGVASALQEINNRLVIATDLPHTIVLGEGASGTLGGGGESETRNLNEFISGHQEKVLTKPIDKDLEIIQSQIQGPTRGNVLNSLAWDYSPLRELTEGEKQDIKTKQSVTDKTYFEIGSLSSEEIRKSRFGGREYSTETIIEDEDESRDDAIKDHGHGDPLGGYTDGATLEGEVSVDPSDVNHLHRRPNGQLTGPAVYLPSGSHFHRAGDNETSTAMTLETIDEIETMVSTMEGSK